MAEMWKPKDPELLASWVTTIIEEASDELSDWESSFIGSIEEQLSKGYQLSEKQENIVEKIYAKYTK